MLNDSAAGPTILDKFNELPASYKTWLDFYDALPAVDQPAPMIRFELLLTRDEVYELTKHRSTDEQRWRYTIEREFLLARIGEEILRYRLPLHLL